MPPILNKNGYVVKKSELSSEQIRMIEEDLTVVPFKMDDYTPVFLQEKDYVPVYQESEADYCLPKYYGLEKFGTPIDRLTTKEYPKIPIEFYVQLRHYQEDIMKILLEGLEKHKGGILTMGCGRGKTNMAIYLINLLKLKTLIITHAGFLQNQIIDRIKSSTNIDKIGGFGYIQGKTLDTNHPIVVATVQSLSMKEYDRSVFKDFGLVIIDETHHMGGKTFHKAFYKINAPYMLGLTATPRRNDGMFKVINWYMGPQLYYEEQPNNSDVRCKIINFSVLKENENFKEYVLKGTDKPNRSKMISNLTLIKSRNTLIIHLLMRLLKQKRKVLALGGRIDHLKLLQMRLDKEETGHTTGLYIGEMSKPELIVSEKADVIFGSYQMAQEGLDIDNLDTLVLLTPISDIQQSIGRILRKPTGEYGKIPVVYDICDRLSVFIRQGQKRLKYYRSKEYQCQTDLFTDADVKEPLILKNKIKETAKLFTSIKPQEEQPTTSVCLMVED